MADNDGVMGPHQGIPVGTASSIPLDRQGFSPTDEISWTMGPEARDNSRTRPSLIRFGDPTSPQYEAYVNGPEPPPPPVKDTTIGTVIVSGSTDGTVGGQGFYSASSTGDAPNKQWSWSAVGGEVEGGTRADSSMVRINWTVSGAGSVTVLVTDDTEGVQDSPQSDTINVTVVDPGP